MHPHTLPCRYAKDIDLRPARLPSSWLGWILPVLMYKEEDVIDEVGLDAAIYLRLISFGKCSPNTLPHQLR